MTIKILVKKIQSLIKCQVFERQPCKVNTEMAIPATTLGVRAVD
jgi:hypothetical protein